GSNVKRMQFSHQRNVPVVHSGSRPGPLCGDGGSKRQRAHSDLTRRPRRSGGKPSTESASAFRRHLTSRIMTALVVILSFTAVLALVLILGNLIVKGASSIDWASFTKSPVPARQSGGGVANAIVGPAIIVVVAA